MVRQRDYRAEYARRQAAARARGFGSYYERRVAGVPKGSRTEVRGHRGTRDFLAFLREGDLILCDITAVEQGMVGRMVPVTVPDKRFRSGRRVTGRRRIEVLVYLEIEKIVIPSIRLGRRGRPLKRQPGNTTFVLKRLTRDELLEVILEEDKRGVIFSPSPSMDQRRLLSDVETEGGY